MRAADVMTMDPVCIFPDASIAEAIPFNRLTPPDCMPEAVPDRI
jgi:hypothetical protein